MKMTNKFCLISWLILFSSISLGANIIGLDVRTLEETKENPASQAIHIPLAQLNAETTKNLNKDREIYVFCESGRRADIAKKILIKLGHRDVINISSWRDWNKMKTIK